jgi:pyruvate/2-oxoglutarate dehydrogenase complex dihydrolipoamide dehydrogenase (E3) component
MSRLFAMELQDVSVSIIEAAHILPSFDEKLRNFAEKKIRQRHQMKLVKGTVTGELH